MKFNATAMLLFVVSSLAVATETSERNPAAVAERVAAVAVSPVKKAMVRSEGEFKLLDRSPRKPGGGGGVDEDEEDGDEEEVDEEEVDEEEVDEEEDEEYACSDSDNSSND